MSDSGLAEAIERAASDPAADRDVARSLVARLLGALEAGTVRAASPSPDGWQVHPWVKRGLLLAFRCGVNVELSAPPFHFRDRDTLPARDLAGAAWNVRIVPGGSTVRRGTFLGDGVVMMPPSFVNAGAYVGAGTMIDSHVLVGSCAQIGARVHLSAAAQIGGVLEPPGAMPVVVEDGAFIGGGCGVYEGARVGRGAVLAPGVVLTRAIALYDAVNERTLSADSGGTLSVPERAVVVPGTRPARGAWSASHGLSLYAPVIVKYRDEKTDAAAALEEALR
jgi:2,3,4,5-tetrahydropyridine-2-carboxylate N-succinyltransferase